eukprot:Amastigsp_a510190_15.p3 type:complete len:146 gc:universal Amastigsp_a510190_15:550-113(-)
MHNSQGDNVHASIVVDVRPRHPDGREDRVNNHRLGHRPCTVVRENSKLVLRIASERPSAKVADQKIDIAVLIIVARTNTSAIKRRRRKNVDWRHRKRRRVREREQGLLAHAAALTGSDEECFDVSIAVQIGTSRLLRQAKLSVRS